MAFGKVAVAYDVKLSTVPFSPQPSPKNDSSTRGAILEGNIKSFPPDCKRCQLFFGIIGGEK